MGWHTLTSELKTAARNVIVVLDMALVIVLFWRCLDEAKSQSAEPSKR